MESKRNQQIDQSSEQQPDSKKKVTKPAKQLEITTDDQSEGEQYLGQQQQQSQDYGAKMEQIINPSWEMFQIIGTLGEGAYGKVFKVKCLKSSIISGEGKVLTPTMRMRKKLTKNLLGYNMGSSISNSNQIRELFQDQQYVVKEIDTAKWPKEIALEQMMEIELLAELESPYIVGYLDAFIEDTRINIIMEYCQNGDLQSYIKKQNNRLFSDNFIWKVFIQICLGVHYLHSQNILHRDLKTLNILITKDKEAKIGDFGAALRIKDNDSGDINSEQYQQLQKIEEEEQCEDMMLLSGGIEEKMKEKKVGTPFYLAPELWEDKECSKKSDIWAIGVILYELCTHKYPYFANTMEELQAKVLKEKYTPIPQTVSKQFADFIQKCLQKKPESRPSIEEIIMMDVFQQKCKLLKIKLPAEVNIEKIKAQQALAQVAAKKNEEQIATMEKKQSNTSNLLSVKNQDSNSNLKTPFGQKKQSISGSSNHNPLDTPQQNSRISNPTPLKSKDKELSPTSAKRNANPFGKADDLSDNKQSSEQQKKDLLNIDTPRKKETSSFKVERNSISGTQVPMYQQFKDKSGKMHKHGESVTSGIKVRESVGGGSNNSKLGSNKISKIATKNAQILVNSTTISADNPFQFAKELQFNLQEQVITKKDLNQSSQNIQQKPAGKRSINSSQTMGLKRSNTFKTEEPEITSLKSARLTTRQKDIEKKDPQQITKPHHQGRQSMMLHPDNPVRINSAIDTPQSLKLLANNRSSQLDKGEKKFQDKKETLQSKNVAQEQKKGVNTSVSNIKPESKFGLRKQTTQAKADVDRVDSLQNALKPQRKITEPTMIGSGKKLQKDSSHLNLNKLKEHKNNTHSQLQSHRDSVLGNQGSTSGAGNGSAGDTPLTMQKKHSRQKTTCFNNDEQYQINNEALKQQEDPSNITSKEYQKSFKTQQYSNSKFKNRHAGTVISQTKEIGYGGAKSTRLEEDNNDDNVFEFQGNGLEDEENAFFDNILTEKDMDEMLLNDDIEQDSPELYQNKESLFENLLSDAIFTNEQSNSRNQRNSRKLTEFGEQRRFATEIKTGLL